jgi:hypothetical protein
MKKPFENQQYASLGESVAYIMKATGKTRRQAEQALLEKMRSGEVRAWVKPPPVTAMPSIEQEEFHRMQRNWRPAPDFVLAEVGDWAMSDCQINALSPDYPMLWIARHGAEWCWGMKLGDKLRPGQHGYDSAEEAKDACWRAMAAAIRNAMT